MCIYTVGSYWGAWTSVLFHKIIGLVILSLMVFVYGLHSKCYNGKPGCQAYEFLALLVRGEFCIATKTVSLGLLL